MIAMYHGGYPSLASAMQQQQYPTGPPSTNGLGSPQLGSASGPYQSAPSMHQSYQQQYQHPQPHPQPYGHPTPTQNDPNAFANMFKSHLAALTFNSKPIITNVTMIALENAAVMAPVVAQCLEEHIMTTSPAYRLPALYALDSICKNGGEPYTHLWAGRIMAIFMETYRVVDHAVKVRMEAMLKTWRDSGANRMPLFGPDVQQSIERALWGDQPPSHAKGGDVGGIVGRFDRLIATCNHDRHFNPHSFDVARMDALTKLRGIVANTSLSPEELGQIVAQLDMLEKEMQGRTPQGQSPPHHAGHGYRATPPVQAAQAVSNIIRSPAHHPVPAASAIAPSLAGALAHLGKLSGGLTPPLNRSTPPPQPPSFDLVASLRQAGLLPAGTPAAPDQDAEYCQMVKGLHLKLTTIDLQRGLPLGSLEAVSAKELPLQCRQCVKRYPSGPKGQAGLDKHLDWHFRQNRRAKDSAVRGQSRSWFSKLDEWVRGGHDDIAPLKRAGDGDGSGNGNGDAGGIGAVLTPAQEAELNAATLTFVVAPNDDPDASTRPCPVCKELFKSEWSEDEEEWIWKNCVKVDGVYFHGSCHYSAKTLSGNVGRIPSGNSSRDGTPQPGGAKLATAVSADPMLRVKEEQGAGSLVSILGTKRKSSADENGSDDEKHSEGSLPTISPAKRMALNESK